MSLRPTFMEATYSAAWFDRFDVMEEAFRQAQLTQWLSGQPGVSSRWRRRLPGPKRKRARTLQRHAADGLAENLAPPVI